MFALGLERSVGELEGAAVSIAEEKIKEPVYLRHRKSVGTKSQIYSPLHKLMFAEHIR